jgi:hypothetical protein
MCKQAKAVSSLQSLTLSPYPMWFLLYPPRWAMLAAAGAIAPEVLAAMGVIPPDTGLPWFEAGGLFSNNPGM